MPNARISMSKLKQLIGLQSSNLSVRALGRALALSMGAVSKYLRTVRECGSPNGTSSCSNTSCRPRPLVNGGSYEPVSCRLVVSLRESL
jgi:hypothetical protein